MKDSTKARLDEIIDHRTRAKQAAQDAIRANDAKESEARARYSEILRTIIRPTVEEFARHLKSKGVSIEIADAQAPEQGIKITLLNNAKGRDNRQFFITLSHTAEFLNLASGTAGPGGRPPGNADKVGIVDMTADGLEERLVSWFAEAHG